MILNPSSCQQHNIYNGINLILAFFIEISSKNNTEGKLHPNKFYFIIFLLFEYRGNEK